MFIIIALVVSWIGHILIFCDSFIFQSLPPPVKRRLKALKKIQLETTKIEAKFYEEVHKLECKYHLQYSPFYEKRAQITKGKPSRVRK